MQIIKDKITLYTENTDKFNTFYLCLCFCVPLENKTAAVNRLIPMILGSGCDKYKTLTELNRVLAETGGAELAFQTIKKGSFSILQFMIKAPKGKEEKAFELLSELLERPFLKNGEFAIDKKEQLKNLIENKSKKEQALDRCIELMFDGFGFGINGDGSIEDLKNTGIIYHRYKELKNSSEKMFFVIGNISAEKAFEYINKYFPNIKSTKNNKNNNNNTVSAKVIEKAELSQAKYCAGIDMGKGSRFEKQIFNEAFGGTNSRLFSEIREKNNLCYYIGSTYYSLANAAFVQAGIDPNGFEQVTELIKKQLEKPFSKEETEKAKNVVIQRLNKTADHPFAMMDRFLTQSLFDDPVGIDEEIEIISKLSEIKLSPVLKTVYMLGGDDN